MTTQLQLRRDTTTNIAGVTPAQGEPVADISFSPPALVLGDGSQAGGWRVTPTTGTWTPQLQFGGAHAGMTLSGVSGTWTQIGNLVFFECGFTVTAKGSSTGAATVTGQPFAATAGGQAILNWWSGMATSPNFDSYVTASASAIALGKSGGTSWAALADTDFANGAMVSLSGWYFAAWPTA